MFGDTLTAAHAAAVAPILPSAGFPIWPEPLTTVVLIDRLTRTKEAGMDADHGRILPEGAQGDVLIYMSCRLLVVDYLVPEAFTIDLVALEASDPGGRH